MSDLELLFLVIAILYGWECACWLRVGSVGFLSWFGRRWRIAVPGTLLGNQRGGFIFAPPLPPLGTILVGQPFPLSLSREAFMPGAGSSQVATLTSWNEVQHVTVDGKKVKLNGRAWFTAGSAPGAIRLARRLDALRKMAPDKRGAAIDEWFQESLDIKAIEKRWAEFCLRAMPLKMLTNWVFVYLFLFAPLLISRAGLSRCWVGLLVGLFALTTCSAVLFHRVHKAFFAEAADDRFTHFLITLLSPVTTIRARDALTRPLLEEFHPMAIAKVFCSEEIFSRLARRAVLDLRYPLRRSDLGDRESALEREACSGFLRAVEKFLRKQGVNEQELTRPPAPNDATCRSYCPRCEAQFTTVDGSCPDCGSVPLQPLNPSGNTAMGRQPSTRKEHIR